MAKEQVIRLEGDGLEDIEYDILKKTYGEKRAKELMKNETLEELDPELQEIVDSTPALV